ncbi:ABC transporter permease [Dactylosporangium sucinum]|uniref:ABC transporter substrate-binding protein n=1 Tax=Dactylosporangium sucinum TaxID=1424081 RepID=A0A917TDZ1_9ACTN|nr:ABC transporter permease [Dactylosporangium sucinum]GGM19375.1 ABC transporter substrate-binding protein [Dactylosporangium sucinum]
MLRTTFAGLRAHKLRLLLTATAIMIGVGFLAGTLVYGDTAKAAFFDDLARAAKNVDASVGTSNAVSFAETSRRLDDGILDDVRAVPGVAHADGRMAERLPMLDPKGRLISNLGRIGWALSTPGDGHLSMYDVGAGRLPARPGEVAIDDTTAEIYGFKVGQRVSVVGPDQQPVALDLVGIMDLGANKRFAGLTVAALTPADMRTLTGADGYAEVVVSASPGVTQRELADRLQSKLGGRARVLTGDEVRADYAVAAAKYVDGFLVVIFGFGLIALAVSVFVIYNTFAILVAQRVRELALLRCVGASRPQIFGSVVLEAVVVGVVASLGGLLVSTVVGEGLLIGRNTVGSGVRVDRLIVTPTTVLVGVCAGTFFTVVASLLPAVTASRIPPLAALRATTLEAAVPGRRPLRTIVAGVIAAGGGLLMLFGTRVPGFNGVPIVFAGAIAVFTGIVIASPLIVSRLTSWAGWLPARLLGAPARLAVTNALRNPKRVAATTSALMIGLALMSVFSVLLATARAQAEQELDENFAVDYIISGVYTPGGQARRVPLAVAEVLRSHSELAAVAAARSRDADVGGRRAEVWSMEPGALDTVLRPEITAGSAAALQPGTVALNRFFADAIGARVGSSVEVRSRTLRVAALYDDAPMDGQALVDWSDYAAIFGTGDPDQVLVKAARGVSPEASRAAVDASLSSAPLTQVSSQAEWRARVTGTLDEQLGVFSALLGMSIVIGLTGIANTLALSVLERTRESALLRALGLSRGQLRGMLVLEAMLMAVVGAVVGVGFGVLVGVAASVGLIRQYGHGHPVLPYGQLLLYVALAAVAGAVAALLPARRAAKTEVAAVMAAD